MPTPIQEDSKVAQAFIISEKYYVLLYQQSLLELDMTQEGVSNCEYTDKQLVILMNDFHERLPDASEIRRFPFSAICNIAEKIFDIYDEE